MIGKLTNLFAYKKAPKATYIAKHPVKGTKALFAAKGSKALFTGRSGLVLGSLAAIPVGMWAASRLSGS